MSDLFSNDISNPLVGNPYQNEFAVDKAENYNMYQQYLDELNRRNANGEFNSLQIDNFKSGINSYDTPDVIFNKNREGVLNNAKANNDKLLDKIAKKEARAERRANFEEGFNNNAQTISAISSLGAGVGNFFLNRSYSDNQKSIVSEGLFNDQMYDDINNTNTIISATNPYDVQQQQQGIIRNLNANKTDKLSKGQIAGMAGTKAAERFSQGAMTGNPYVAIAMGIEGAGEGLFKGIRANKKIDDNNISISQKANEVNNYMNKAMMDIRANQMARAKQSYFNNSPYNKAYGGYIYANGGLMNPYGINEINNGKTHEQNKFGGVPVSIAEDGKPNLVEEGEVIYDDYVYSNRIKINDKIRERLRLKDSIKTFAEAAKEIKDRGSDRPNDPVTEHTIKAHMQILKSAQEDIKEKKEQREQEKMLAQMSEQERQMLEQQQMEQQANAYEQQMAAEQQAQIAQQVPQEGMPQEQMPMQEQQQPMYAEGGKLKGGTDDIDAHRFAEIKTDKTKKKANDTLNEDVSDYVVGLIQAIQDNNELSDSERQEAYDNLFNTINEYQIRHSGLRGQPLTPKSDAVKKLQDDFKKFGIDINDAIIGKNFEVGEGGITGDSAEKGWVSDGYMGNETLARTLGYQLNDEQIAKVQQALKNAGVDNWSFKNNFSDKATDYSGFIKNDPTEISTEVTERPIYDWKYKPNWIPGAIDAGLLAQSYAPADYSRARSIENTPIRDIQYNPNGNYIKPYIIDPRQQYMMNYANAQATNRAIQNNAGGNGANATAAMLANNAAANQSAAQIGFQADAANADSINKAIAFNNAVDAQNAQGFLQASEANQRADAQRGEFNYYGKMLREQIDKQRGQAISNSLDAVADDFNNYYNDRYNRGMIAGLAESGYFGEMPENSLLRKNAGLNVVGRESVDGRNYFEDATGRHYLTQNGSDFDIDDIKNVFLKNVNGKYYKTNRV